MTTVGLRRQHNRTVTWTSWQHRAPRVRQPAAGLVMVWFDVESETTRSTHLRLSVDRGPESAPARTSTSDPRSTSGSERHGLKHGGWGVASMAAVQGIVGAIATFSLQILVAPGLVRDVGIVVIWGFVIACIAAVWAVRLRTGGEDA